MRCFHVPKDHISDNQIKITGSELHHLINVLRLRGGDEIIVLDGVGGIYDVLLKSVSSKLAIGKIKSWKQAQPSPIQVSLIQGITKADSMEIIMQKATELDVYEIIPAICQHSVPNLSDERAEKRLKRWRQIAIEASKQSHRSFFPIIHEIADLNDALGKSPADLRLIFIAPSIDYISPQSLKSILAQNSSINKVQIIIGPEGDFTKDEIEIALLVGAIPVSLGNNILRTETASIASLAILFYELKHN